MNEHANKIIMTIGVVGPMLGVLLAISLAWNRYVFASDIALMLVLYAMTTMGATIGYHRMLTHKGFDAPAWLRGLFLILGCMAYAGSKPDEWAATHIRHHAHSDEEGDPHSPLEGFWHAHFGWLFSISNFSEAEEYAPHLLADRTVQFVGRWWFVWTALAFLTPFAIGGWTGLLWGGVVRLFLTTHITWSVNSVCHTFGKRDFETTDESRNEWVIGLLAFGEGWHNNHHAFPQSAFHGLHWWQLDLSGALIRLLERCGLAWNVQRVSAETLHAHKERAILMVQSVQDLRQQVMQSVAGARQEVEAVFSKAVNESLMPEEYARLRALHDKALRRLATIRAVLTRAIHAKRPTLLQYMREAQELAQQVRAAAQRGAGVAVCGE